MSMRLIDRPSPNWDDRPPGQAVDMLVLHYTDMESAEASAARLCDPAAKVSAHYLIDEDGTVFALVPEERRAWHAGVSFWRGETAINARSIGIELQNPGHSLGYRAFPDAQIAALTELCRGILGRHPIPPRNVVGHSDVAPDRKIDPGELFPWERLAKSGIGIWPAPAFAKAADLPGLLAEIGYNPDAEKAAAAFQRRFRTARIDNIGDDETASLAAGFLQSRP